jgi:transcriptional regulator with XRE-family HTH domain/SOS-response transcriptional repressor LexA
MAEMDFLTRLRVAVALIGKQKDAAAATHISAARLSNYLRGVNKPGRAILESLAASAKVQPAWLIGGEGPMLAADDGRQDAKQEPGASADRPASAPAAQPCAPADPSGPAPVAADLLRAIQGMQALLTCCVRLLSDAGRQGIAERQEAAANEILSAEDYACLDPARQKHYVALVGREAVRQAFGPAEASRAGRGPCEYIFAPGVPPGTFAVRIEAASMMPELPPGAIVLIGAPLDPLPDCPVRGLVLYEDEAGAVRHTIKMVCADKNEVRLRALNPRFQGEQRVPRDRVLTVLGVIGRLA